MAALSDQVRELFDRFVNAGEFAKTKISFRVVGGMRDEPQLPPLPPPDEVLIISGKGEARLLSDEGILSEAPLLATQIAPLFEQVRSNLPALVPVSEARFVPDSLVGEVTIEVNGDEDKLYFSMEDERAQPGEQPVEQGLGDLRSRLADIAALLRSDG